MFSFEITPLGNFFAILAFAVFGSLVFVSGKRRNIVLYALLIASLLAIFYANDLVTLFIGWEVMSWSSYFMISQSSTIKTSQKYIIFNLAGGFALLGAIALIYSASGSFAYDKIAFGQMPYGLQIAISILLLLTIFIKSGIMPFHYWVVDAYAQADDKFSTILSALISKSGIFLFVLMFTKIIGYENLSAGMFGIVAWLGVITSIIATFKAISQDELKRLLAYSSIAQIGYIITIFSVLNAQGLEAGLYHAIMHTFTKLLLFMNIASIIYITGKKRFSELGGLIYKYPVLFFMLLIGIIALAGMPPLGGFSSKFLIYTTLLEEKKALLLAAVMFSSASSFLYCYKLIYSIYLGQANNDQQEHKKLPFGYYIPQFLGALILIVLGVMPSLGVEVINPVLEYLKLETFAYSSPFVLETSFASFNGGAIMAIFGGIFLFILAAVTAMKSKAIKPRDRYDISYCGEVPQPQNNLHFGYGVGEELRRIGFVKLILQNSSKSLWERVSRWFGDISTILQKLYSLSTQNIGILIAIFFTTLLFLGVR